MTVLRPYWVVCPVGFQNSNYSSNWSKSIQPKVLWSKSPDQKPHQRRNCELNHVTSQLFKSLLDIRNIWTYFPNFQGASHTKIKLSNGWKVIEVFPRNERWKFLLFQMLFTFTLGIPTSMSLRKPQHTPGTYYQTPNQRFMKEFLSSGGLGIPGVCSKGMLGFS